MGILLFAKNKTMTPELPWLIVAPVGMLMGLILIRYRSRSIRFLTAICWIPTAIYPFFREEASSLWFVLGLLAGLIAASLLWDAVFGK